MRYHNLLKRILPYPNFASMQRLLLASLLVLLISASQNSPVSADSTDNAMRDAVERSVTSLEQTMATHAEKFEGIERLAILPIQGEGGQRLTELLTARVTKTSLSVMERGEIERLLAEHRFAGDEFEDLFSAQKETVARLGEFLGAKAYLMGHLVSSAQREAGSQTINEVVLNIKLVNVETGEIVWAEDITGSNSRPSTSYQAKTNKQQASAEKQKQESQSMQRSTIRAGLIAAVVLGVLIAAAIAFSRKPATVSPSEQRSASTDILKQDRALRNRLGAEVSKAQAHLNQARQKADAAERGEVADRMRDLDNRLGTVKRSVEQATFGTTAPEKIDNGSLKRLLDFEKALDQNLQTLTSRSETVACALVDNGKSEVGKDLDTIEKEMVAFEQRFKERTDYLKGLL